MHDILARLDTLADEVRELRALVARLDVPAPEFAPEISHLPAPPRLRFYCLGRFEMFIDDQPMQHRHVGKGWSILKILAGRLRRPIHRDMLLEMLWPQADPEIANNRLHVAMHHVRRALLHIRHEHIGSVILFRNGCYAFDPGIDLWFDVEAFRAAWQAGRDAEQSGHTQPAVEQYQRALQLYRGDFLEEDRYEEWTLLPREELRDLYLAILDRLGRLAFDNNDLEAALGYWRTLLTNDPWREDVYRRMMLGCALNGQRGQALHWYDVCCRVLSEQLGFLPESETIELAERIRSGEMTN